MISVLIVSAHLYAQPNQDLVIVDEKYSFYLEEVCIYDGYAYLINTRGLSILDISDPTLLAEVSSVITDDIGQAVDVENDIAVFTTSYSNRLRVVDVSDPLNPQVLAESATAGFPVGVELAGDYAYIANGSSGLQIWDISDPANPVVAGSLASNDYAQAVRVDGSLAYLADNEAGLRILDVSDPATPVELGSYDHSSFFALDVRAGDGYAYLAYAAEGMIVVDVSNPANPVESGIYNPGTAIHGLYYQDGIVYGGFGYLGLQLIDVSDPQNPSFLGGLDTPGYANSGMLDGDIFYHADGSGGLRVVDVSDPAEPSEISFFERDYIQEMVFAGDYAYIANDGAGLCVFDISDPAAPQEIAFHFQPGKTTGIDYQDGLVYTVGEDTGLRITDVSDPHHPVEVGYAFAEYATRVKVKGDYAFVANYDDELTVWDVSDPANPTHVATYLHDGREFDVELAGNYMFIANGQYGMTVMDITDPLQATTVAHEYVGGSQITNISLSGGYAYLGADDDAMMIYDIGDPTQPVQVGSVSTQSSVVAVDAANGFVLMMADQLYLVDARIPFNPTVISYHDPNSWGIIAQFVGDYAYCSESNRFAVLDCNEALMAPTWVTLDLTADEPLIVPRGSSFQYDVELYFNPPQTHPLDIWVEAVRPSGETIGPLPLMNNLNLVPGTLYNVDGLSQFVPAAIPAGNYIIRMRAGQLPALPVAQAELEIEVVDP